MTNKSIILLSGGLDSLVSLALKKSELNIDFAITFDYGQKSLIRELEHSEMICHYFNLKHEIIKLDWLKNISTSSLTTADVIPEPDTEKLDNIKYTQKTANSVWVPNRNALFINIAACYAEALNYSHIIIGANKEEGATFKDNSIPFINAVNESLKQSSNKKIIVNAPLIDYDKSQIIKLGLDINVPFNLVYSCYTGSEKHCGKCESCLRLKRALKLNNREDIISEIF